MSNDIKHLSPAADGVHAQKAHGKAPEGDGTLPDSGKTPRQLRQDRNKELQDLRHKLSMDGMKRDHRIKGWVDWLGLIFTVLSISIILTHWPVLLPLPPASADSVIVAAWGWLTFVGGIIFDRWFVNR